MKKADRENTRTMKPGQDLIVAGTIGQIGTRIIAQHREEELRNWFSRDYITMIQQNTGIDISGNLELWKRFGATECESVGEGGILTALWNLTGAYQVGIEFTLRQIPVKQETIEICERYDLNPYRLMSGGCLILTADNGRDIVRSLKEEGISSSVIGKVNHGIKRVIYQDGGMSYLDRPQKDELKKVVPSYFQDKL